MFRKEDGAIDMVSLILTVVIAAVTMMVGLEMSDSKTSPRASGFRGRQYGTVDAKHQHICPFYFADKRS